MRKVTLLAIFILFLFAFFGLLPKIYLSYAEISCEWTLLNNSQSEFNGHPTFCVGGFNSQYDAQNYRLDFTCKPGIDICGILAQNHFAQNLYHQQISGEVFPDSSNPGKYFACYVGPFGDAIIQMINNSDVVVKGQCIAGAVVVGGTLIAGGAGSAFTSGVLGVILPATVKASFVGASCTTLLPAIVNLKPTMIGKVSDRTGNVVCSHEWAFSIDPTTGEFDDGKSGSLGITKLCSFVSDPNAKAECQKCTELDLNNPGIYTPFGCIRANPQIFLEQLLTIMISLSGGIAFLMVGYGGFVVMTSAGNPERLTNGREIITSAIAGLLLIIFSTLILRIIGVNVLRIPGL